MPDWLFHFAQAAEGKGSKTTALQPLLFVCIVVAGVLVTAATQNAAAWLQVGAAIVLALLLIVYVIMFVYFARTNPDCLRSERYAIRKMEIEQSAIGDTERGFMNGSLPSGGRAKLVGGASPRVGGEES